MADSGNMSSSTRTVLILLFLLMGLIILLIFLYKKLNREASGEYTIRRMVFKEGGLRDRARHVALALGTRLVVLLWPRSDAHEDGEEMWEVQDEEAPVRGGKSHGSDSEDDNPQEEEDNVERCYNTSGEGGDTSDDTSSLESAELNKPMNRPGANRETEKKGEGREEEGGHGEGDSSEGPEFLIDLKQFSRGATWSEEGRVTSDVTSL